MTLQRIEWWYYNFLRKSTILVGILILLCGVIFNVFFFEKYVSRDGNLEVSTKKIIYSFQIVCFFLGGLFIFFGRRMQKLSEKSKNLIINVSFSLCAFFIILLFMECWIRIFVLHQETFSIGGSDPRVFQESDIIPWELKPNASDRFVALDFDTQVSINSLGLRGAERSFSKGKNVKRILVLGDSMTYGFGVENNETYSAVLENLLNKYDTDQEYEVWNAGFTSGYSPDTFYLYLREKGVNFNPGVVIVGLFVENDIIDLWKNVPVIDNEEKIIRIKSDFYSVQNNRLKRGSIENEPSEFQRIQSYVKRILLKSSKLYSYIHQRLSLFFIRENNPIFDKVYVTEVEKNFEQVDFYFGEIKKLTVANDIALIVAFLPGKASVDELWKIYLKKNPGSSREKPRQILQSSCKKYNISCVDLWPEFMNLSNSGSLFFEHDGHWNRRGQHYAAELINHFLISEKMVG